MEVKNKIRVGLLVDDLIIPNWAYSMIERIQSGGYAEVVLIVKKANPVEKKTFVSRLKNNYNFVLYGLYRRMENKFFKYNPDAFENKDLRTLVSELPVLDVTCIEKKFSDLIVEEDIEKIKSANVDVFIRLGFRILRGEILKVAKLGVWSYHHGDNFVNRGGPAGYWEVFRKDREIGSILQILTEDLDGGTVLYRSWSPTYRLLNETLNGYYWKSSQFIPRKLKELYELGEEGFMQKMNADNHRLNFYYNQLYTTPPNNRFIQLFASYSWDWLKLNVWKLFNFEQWILLYSFNKGSIASSLFRYKRMTPPKDRFWADPCVVTHEGKYFVFIEELIYKEKKGHLSVVEIDAKGNYTQPQVILKKPYHLSYPFVFNYNGEYYLIPESEENKSIQLYRATSFPYKWEFVMNLMENVRAVDTTIFIKDNKFWLFTNMKEVEGSNYSEELFLFYADELLTQNWKSHPCNPVISDVKSARPAGKLFFHNDKLYRPSQDCSYKYGYSTVMNEVLVLNEKEYKEVKVSDILPNWAKDVAATHTFSSDGKLSFIDAAVKRRKALGFK